MQAAGEQQRISARSVRPIGPLLKLAALSGATAAVLLSARGSPRVVLAGLVCGPALVIQLRCRRGWPIALAVSASALFGLAMLKDYLRG